MCDREDCPARGHPAAFSMQWKGDVTNPDFNHATDLYKDGYHALPGGRWAKKQKNTAGSRQIKPILSPEQAQSIAQEFEEEYKTLSEPRPLYLSWLWEKTTNHRANQLFVDAVANPLTGERTKANLAGSEYAEVKPKQQIEMMSKTEGKADALALIVAALEAMPYVIPSVDKDLVTALKDSIVDAEPN